MIRMIEGLSGYQRAIKGNYDRLPSGKIMALSLGSKSFSGPFSELYLLLGI
jgi:hypothetical protein